MSAARSLLRTFLAVSLVSGSLQIAQADDWPTWRHDASRSAAISQKLPDGLTLIWSKQLATPAPAWPEDPKMHFDVAYEPVVVGQTMIVGTNSDDSVVALDTKTSQEKWRFIAEGPVRFAPVIAENKVYFGADDGALYCLSLADGNLQWKIPSPFGNRTVLGNNRLISLWPVRGGPVVTDNALYYTVGVWPFEGAALFRVNLAAVGSGTPQVEVLASFTDDSPQGYLATSEGVLFVPTGRGPAACFSLQPSVTKLNHFGADKRTDSYVTLSRNWLFHGQRVIDFKARKPAPLECVRPVTSGSRVYFVQKDKVVATDLSKPQRTKPTGQAGKPAETYAANWHVPVQAIQDAVAGNDKAVFDGTPILDLLADDCVVGHWGNVIFVIRSPVQDTPARVTWTSVVNGTPHATIAADDKLFVSTREGKLFCYGQQHGSSPVPHVPTTKTPEDALAADSAKAEQGYGVVWGLGDEKLVDELTVRSGLRLVVIDPDAVKIAAFRRRMAAAGVYGTRVAARVGDATTIQLPPYLANLAICVDAKRCKLDQAPAIMNAIVPMIHPFGGIARLKLERQEHEKLKQLVAAVPGSGAKVELQDGNTILSVPSGLPGAADWTHEYGDAANSLMSQDKLVKAPLGILWFGGQAADPTFFYDRHRWPPSPLVVGGRMYLQGMAMLAAVDIYTGQVLWRIPVEKGSSPGRRINFGTRGNREIGYHMAAAEDAVYLCYPTHCLRIAPATGKTLDTFHLPQKSDRWGEIHVVKDKLLIPVFDTEKFNGEIPTRLVALDRTTGETAWEFKPEESCPLLASGQGRVYVYDGVIDELYRDMKRKGKVPKGGPKRYLKALDVQTGKIIWQEHISIVATWVAHSADTDIVVASNQEGMEAREGGTGKILWQKSAASVGFKGHPESRMDRLILWNDRIIDQRGPGLSYNLKSGDAITRPHPLTGDAVPWEFMTTSHHCNYAIASKNLLTFRDGTAGYCDVTDGMTTRLPGFRSGCRSSLIPAGGVLNAPNMAQGCGCAYSVFTSVALVHRPDTESWSYSPLKPPSGRVTRLGINLGAPGDRLGTDGTLWLDWPSNNQSDYGRPGVAGPSPDLEIKMEADKPRWFRLPTGLIEGDGLQWVAASGVEGIRSLTIPLRGQAGEPSQYTVRLVFMEPDELKAGERVFDVSVNGKPALERFDLSTASGTRRKTVVRELAGIVATDALRIELTPTTGRTLLCGVEVVAQPK